jgi:hypothetical protein
MRYTDPSGHMIANDDDYICHACTPLPPPIPDPDEKPKADGPPLIFNQTYHTSFQVHPPLPRSADESYTDFSTGGNPEYTPSLPYAAGQTNVPINDNPTVVNQLSAWFGLANQVGMGWLAHDYLSDPKYAQDVDITYSVTFSANLPPMKNVTGMTITNSTRPTVMNYLVDITNMNGE